MVKMPESMDITVKWDRLTKMFDEQRQLQVKAYGADPGDIIDPEERAQFIKDMTLALEDELHEFLGEVGWKPWATSRHVNEAEAKGELVDAFHFFMNLCMAVHMEPDELFDRYMEKRHRNEQRQLKGYDGVEGKCYGCKRALDDLAKAWGLPESRVSTRMVYRGTDMRASKKAVPVCIECQGGTVVVDD
jgi:hypothetical protein